MDHQEGVSSNIVPLFDGKKYSFWRLRMQYHLQSHGSNVWGSIINGYQVPTNLLTNTTRKKIYNDNSRAINSIFMGYQILGM
jgi:hypothetical protein